MDALETLRHEALKPSQIICFEPSDSERVSNRQSHLILVNKALLRHNYVEMLSLWVYANA